MCSGLRAGAYPHLIRTETLVTTMHCPKILAAAITAAVAIACTEVPPTDASVAQAGTTPQLSSRESAPPSPPALARRPDTATRAPRPIAHCTPKETTLFSCTLEDSNRTISLCSASTGETRFVSGPLGAPDVVYPRSHGESAAFERTTLTYAGGSAGYAYSFDHADQTRVIYSVSGEQETERQGELLTDRDFADVRADHRCASGTVIETDDLDVLRRVGSWPEQPRLARHGLPQSSP